jgi:hypothetical protein
MPKGSKAPIEKSPEQKEIEEIEIRIKKANEDRERCEQQVGEFQSQRSKLDNFWAVEKKNLDEKKKCLRDNQSK